MWRILSRPCFGLLGMVVLVLLTLLVSCSEPIVVRPVVEPATVMPRPQNTPIAPTIGVTSTDAPLPTATIIPSSTPTATPLPEVNLYVPAWLWHNVRAAVQDAESSGALWRWNLVGAREEAHVILEPGDSGIPAGYRAIALTVPFTSHLESFAGSEAIDILSNGMDGIAAMDWAEMPPSRRALRIDGMLPADEGYPLTQSWSLIPHTGFEEAAGELGSHLSQHLSEDQLIHLVAVGDLMLDRAIGRAIERGDTSFPFEAVASELERADMTVGNLESALGDLGQPENKSYTFRAPPAAAGVLRDAGFDLLSLANNHAMDYGPEAMHQALVLLDEAEIGVVGAGTNARAARQPFVLQSAGLSVAFLGYVDVPVEVSGFDTRDWAATEDGPGIAWADPGQIKEDVAAAAIDSDLVVVLLHSGHEYVQAPSPEQITAARTAIDAGADLVIGHHAHVLQGAEFRKGAVIAYGLGNFAFEIDGDPSTSILNVWLEADGVRQIEYLPAIIEAGGRPRIAAPWEAYDIRQRVYYLSGLLPPPS